MISKLDLNDSLSFKFIQGTSSLTISRIHGIISGIMVDTLISTSEVQTRKTLFQLIINRHKPETSPSASSEVTGTVVMPYTRNR